MAALWSMQLILSAGEVAVNGGNLGTVIGDYNRELCPLTGLRVDSDNTQNLHTTLDTRRSNSLSKRALMVSTL